ncbi:hypothetical protein [Streptomyces millisiae]|uniref:Uncharacterized protein n=1 Tax=Streptomyces millisiae TaxID=3075542 RepID=A0ABU2LP40_9ACTN|nr:hypothetical protein [Streptomyces sp. DSM 44918]MDT0319349.1 hypothetical protein [Streptomyces sp. DSM 44918]
MQPRWLPALAHVTALTPLPAGLWRVAGAFGVPLGFAEGSGLHPSEISPGFACYLIGLSVVSEGVALLTLGLVRPWGRVVPGRVPWLGGRRIPPLASFLPAITGATLLTLLSVRAVLTWNAADMMGGADAPQGTAYWVMTAVYTPMAFWGPLLAVVAVVSYRHRPSVNRLPAVTPAR